VRDVTATEEAVAVPDLTELASVSQRLEHQPATAIIRWAHEEFGDGLVLASSFQDCVLIDLAMQVSRDIEVVFLDTQYHFAETLWYVDRVKERYGLNLRVLGPETPADDRWLDDPDGCCKIRKVEPLLRALEGRSAWMTGLRRSETPQRAAAPIVSWDLGRGLVKVNPIATWSDDDATGYGRDRALPEHPLRDRGYASIGCWSCTRPVLNGGDPRDGRWAGTDKIECGLHD
jgi:phosphoadenosine phosphosulfate reductase